MFIDGVYPDAQKLPPSGSPGRAHNVWVDEEFDDEDEEEHPLPAGYYHQTDVIRCREHLFEAPEDGCFLLLLINWDDEATEVAVDAAVWEAED